MGQREVGGCTQRPILSPLHEWRHATLVSKVIYNAARTSSYIRYMLSFSGQNLVPGTRSERFGNRTTMYSD